MGKAESHAALIHIRLARYGLNIALCNFASAVVSLGRAYFAIDVANGAAAPKLHASAKIPRRLRPASTEQHQYRTRKLIKPTKPPQQRYEWHRNLPVALMAAFHRIGI